MSFLRQEILLIILLAYPATSAALPAEISVDPAYQSIEKGQDLSINISIDPVNNSITGAQFDLYFNSSLVTIKNVTEGNLFGQNGANTAFSSGNLNNPGGTLFNAWGLIIIPGSNVSTKGTLATISMTSTGTGTADFNLSNVIISDPDSQEVQVNITNGSVDIASTSYTTEGGNSGGGGGGGGAGGASAENYTNIELKEKYDLYIYKGVTTSYCFRQSGNPITCVNITGNANAGEITTTVEVLRDRSTLLDTSPDGIIYKHINIWVGTSRFATPKNIKDATIAFRVDKSWMYENSIDPASVTLMRYSNGWKTLPTEKTGGNDAEFYYEAKTDGFAHFAIIARNSAIQVNSKVVTMSAEMGYAGPQETIPESEEKPENQPNNAGALSVFMLVGALIGSTYNASLIFFKMIKPELN